MNLGFDLDTLWPALFFVAAGSLIAIASAYTDLPIVTMTLRSGGDHAYAVLKQVLAAHGFSLDTENKEELTIRVKRVMRFSHFFFYQCWSRDVSFKIKEDETGAKLIVSCRPNPVRYYASPGKGGYLSRDEVDSVVRDFVSSV